MPSAFYILQYLLFARCGNKYPVSIEIVIVVKAHYYENIQDSLPPSHISVANTFQIQKLSLYQRNESNLGLACNKLRILMSF